MNPYTFTNLINPTMQPDRREVEKNFHDFGLDQSISRSVYRAVVMIGQLPFRWKR